MRRQEQNTLAIDPGSSIIRFGTSDDSAPTLQVPTLIGRPKHVPNGVFMKEEFVCHVGRQLHEYPSRYDDFKPIITNGIVQNWDDMMILLEDCLLKVPNFVWNSSDYSRRLVLTETLMNSLENRKKWYEIMFEYFDFDSMVIQTQSLLALLASGRSTGMVLDIGEDCTQILPVFDGFVLTHLMNKVRLGGADLTKYVSSQLSQVGLKNDRWEGDLKYESGWELTNTGKEISKQIKEKVCYVALDFQKETQLVETSNQLTKTYELPDKSIITIDELRFRCGEVLFRPSQLLGVDYVHGGVDDLLIDTLLKSPIDCRTDLYKNILICGGSSQMEGIRERLEIEVQNRLFPNINYLSLNNQSRQKVKQVECLESEREHLPWIGASILGSLGIMTHYQFSRRAYLDEGADVFRPYSLNLC